MILTIENLHKSYARNDRPVINGLDLALESGQIAAVLGKSGSGKSTLLKTIAGLESIQQGKIILNDRVVSGPKTFVPPEKRHVGYLFQDFALFPHLNVAQNVGFGISNRKERPERVKHILELVGMGSHEGKYPHELSGGEQQRVALARAMAPNPTLLLLDEPFSNLDAHVRKSIRTVVFSIIRSLGLSCIFVTHDLEDAQEYADTVSILHKGRIVQCGTPEELYLRPVSAHVAGFFGDINVLDRKMIERFQLPLPEVGSYGVRQVDIKCSLHPEERSIPANVLKHTHMGYHCRLRVEIPQAGYLDVLLPNIELNGHKEVFLTIAEEELLHFKV